MDHLRVLSRIREIAMREPARPALRAGGRSIDFGELFRAATRVRDLLLARGAGPEDIVATILPRGGNAVIAMLGIWMSGAAYLPADVRWPRRRLDLVLAESAACVLEEADAGAGAAGMPGEAGLRLRWLEPGRDRGRAAAPSPRNLAYVLYTSGSTGTPNAVGVEYAALDNYASYLRELAERSPGHADGRPAERGPADGGPADGGLRVLLSANLSFDASLRPVLLLAAGATLAVAPDLAESSWHELIDCILDHGVTALSGVPSWYSGLLGAGYRPRDSRVRLAFIGGEAVPNGVVRELSAGGCTVVVQYGPTETAIAASGGILSGGDFTEPPIGEAIPGTRIYLYRDDGARMVTEGEPGQLCVGGAGVARGYLNNPRLTAERFVPSPAGPPGARMFRSGDLGRMLPRDGYSFLGRQDDQVKISGQRIEPGEVSAVLNRHPAVGQSVAFADRGGTRPRLVACYVGSTGAAEPGADESIRDYLAAELPGYLVPALIRRVECLPVTERGKVDVAALAAVPAAGDAGKQDDSGAQEEDPGLGDVEWRLIAIVRKTLRVPCTLDDNFFALGGGSLDALDVLARIREEFRVRVRLRDFYKAGTIRALRDLMGEAE
ncbi:MAG: non-ribosomal peptide synthetase [Trebonia sp.]